MTKGVKVMDQAQAQPGIDFLGLDPSIGIVKAQAQPERNPEQRVLSPAQTHLLGPDPSLSKYLLKLEEHLIHFQNMKKADTKDLLKHKIIKSFKLTEETVF